MKFFIILLIISAFLLFFFLVEFIWFVSKNKKCARIENFDLKCVGKNVITLSELLNNTKLDADTMLEQIQQIPFTPTERSNFNPIIHSTFITLSKDKIENLKQSIMLNYIINCKYNSISQVNDIKYLNSENAEIKKILQNKDTPPSKIIEISLILKKNVHA